MSKMKGAEVYPVYVNNEEDSILVYIPDWDIHTYGEDLADAMYMSRDAIGLMAIDFEEEGKDIPVPFSIRYEMKEGEREALVDVNFVEYKRQHDSRKVKKNCTISYWVAQKAEEMGVNFSRVLEDALLQKII